MESKTNKRISFYNEESARELLGKMRSGKKAAKTIVIKLVNYLYYNGYNASNPHRRLF